MIIARVFRVSFFVSHNRQLESTCRQYFLNTFSLVTFSFIDLQNRNYFAYQTLLKHHEILMNPQFDWLAKWSHAMIFFLIGASLLYLFWNLTERLLCYEFIG